ncbi:uncharacterized protein FA14DRAFT_160707 [Meira miltonrushii]|uniref:Uncharacterized protein n=1 Tax=Meira miltonrushii TaxID=1280837 RepID=A0A316VI26_9BASI|nr:uncharacterized protein FA14DRAFT_160707 [Meira miltonrushii]PWN35651.1 hypothetical protein FA14DRAFT_160707 [Meira miltonrushii]
MAAPAIPGQQEFVRPPKSSRRNKTPPNEITQSVTNAYNNAPDLGISSTVQNAYQRAPDLGLQSSISRTLGYSNEQGEDTQAQGEQQPKDHPSEEQTDEKKSLSPYEISKQSGPSSQDRLGKTQREIGTEFGIPTRAGAGTTVSPDKTNALAEKRSHSSHHTRPREANVPEDYAPEPCPTKHAGTGKVDGVEHKSPNAKHEKRISNGSATHRKSESGNQSPQSTTSSERKRRSLGAKLRDQIKGELKILSGSITNNEDKINLGLNIKHGEA